MIPQQPSPLSVDEQFDQKFSQWLAVNSPGMSFEKHAEIVEAACDIAMDLFSAPISAIQQEPGQQEYRITDEALFKAFQEALHAQGIGIHCPSCDWKQIVRYDDWIFQSKFGHGYTCGSEKCPSHTYLVRDVNEDGEQVWASQDSNLNEQEPGQQEPEQQKYVDPQWLSEQINQSLKR